MSRFPEPPAGKLDPVDARAAEWAIRRAADQLASETPGLRAYIDRCIAHRGPQLAIEFIQGNEFDPFHEDLLLATLVEARGEHQSSRYSQPPEIRRELIAWAKALWLADELAEMGDPSG